jgi:hypothetical protein
MQVPDPCWGWPHSCHSERGHGPTRSSTGGSQPGHGLPSSAGATGGLYISCSNVHSVKNWLKHRVHIEWQWLLVRVRGARPSRFHCIYHHVQSCGVRSSWEVRYIPPISTLLSICSLWDKVSSKLWNLSCFPYNFILLRKKHSEKLECVEHPKNNSCTKFLIE